MQVERDFLHRRKNLLYYSSSRSNVGKYERLIDVICQDVPNLQRIQNNIREGAKRIIKLVRSYYPTQGRRAVAIVVVALGIARGDRNVKDLQDLLYRVKYFKGEEIPQGQVHNAFEDLCTFLRLLPYYKGQKCNFNSHSISKKEVIFEKCPECNSMAAYIPETGEVVCTKCGLVLNENINERTVLKS